MSFHRKSRSRGREALGNRADIAEAERLRAFFARLVDVAWLELTGQVLVGTHQLDRKGFVARFVPHIKTQARIKTTMKERRAVANAVIGAVAGHIETGVMLE